MGIFRVLMALSVLLAHIPYAGGYQLVGGEIAVEVFFMISGFYMALILNEKYTGTGALKAFYINRFLRIYVLYWALVVLMLLCIVGYNLIAENPHWLRMEYWRIYGGNLTFETMATLVLAHVFLFGQDVVMWLGFEPNGSLQFVENFKTSNPAVHNFLLIPQAWTLSLELMFYVIAPFLVRSPKKLLAVAALSILLRFVLYSKGYDYDPWTYRLFPTELVFFAVGSLLYFVYKRMDNVPSYMGYVSLGMLVITLGYSYIPDASIYNISVKQQGYYILSACFIPYLFSYSKKMKWDRLLGETSYPIYLVHIFVIYILNGVGLRGGELIISAVVASIIISIAVAYASNHTIEKVRAKIRRNV